MLNLEQFAEKLEIHYFFDDESHDMDAFIRNKCESELLAIAQEVSTQLGIEVRLFAIPAENGGFIDRVKVVAKHPIFQSIVTSVIGGIMVSKLTGNPELDNLHKEYLELSIEKMKRELGDKAENIEKNIENLQKNTKIIKKRSNFYTSLSKVGKVERVTFSALDSSDKPLEHFPVGDIPKSSFQDFILSSDDRPKIIDENATIEIVAPVLKKGKTKWLGIYNEALIKFTVRSKDFKKQVISGDIAFINGTCIDCVLEIYPKLNELGEEYNSRYLVSVVEKVHDEVASVDIPEGKRYRGRKESEKNQLKLNLIYGESHD